MIFRSKIDLWLIVLLSVVALSTILPLFWQFSWLLFVIDVAEIVLLYDMFFHTYYRIEGSRLIVKNGSALTFTYDISSIQSVSPTRTLLSAPALSLDRLKLTMKGGETVVISPKDKDGLIRELLNVNPEIKIVEK
jgi:hypothetical protein